jgi:ubiquinone/menaquinone biosynthesis C-methylase UbiE
VPAIKTVNAHYGKAGLAETILAALSAAGVWLEDASPEDLAPVDQFHMGGREATLELVRLAELGKGREILDVGGGLGGAARTLALEAGATVTVLDATEEFCRTGAKLTQLVGLDDAVAFQHADATAMPFPDGSFDAAWLQHASMNIEAKEKLFRAIHRVLRPGGRLALHEVLAGPVQPIHFPVPWARHPSLSFLRAEQPMRELLGAAGFVEIAWQDTTPAAYEWWLGRPQAAQNGPPTLGIHLLLGPEAPAMGAAMLRNLEEGRVTVAYGVLERR